MADSGTKSRTDGLNLQTFCSLLLVVKQVLFIVAIGFFRLSVLRAHGLTPDVGIFREAREWQQITLIRLLTCSKLG